MRLSVPALVSVALALAGCATKPEPPGSVAKGTCEFLHTPEYVVKGATPYDQAWANKTTEALVVGCNQPRPKARPPELDKAKSFPLPKPKPAAKKSLLRRLLPAKKPSV